MTTITKRDDPGGEPPEEYQGAGAAIEATSFRLIDALVGGQHGYDPEQWSLVRRLIHTSGDEVFNGLTRFHPRAMPAGREAIRRGGVSLVVDVAMIKAGLSSSRLTRWGIHPRSFIALTSVAQAAVREGTTRATQAMRLAAREGLLAGGVVAVGNAPTALTEVIRLVREEGITPALVVGVPVGFVGAAESKLALTELSVPWITVTGTRGGAALAVAALHALMDLAGEGWG